MNAVLDKIRLCGLVPVIKLGDAADAVPLADALMEGGLDVAEFTFRTEAAEASIREVSAQRPDMLVGAGTVSHVETVKRAVDAGARFIVSPGLNPNVVEYCVRQGIPILPGVSSATDIEAALEHGLQTVKYFPAEACGGLIALKAIAAPYSGLRFMPTGGISPQNLAEYLRFPQVIACGGSWICPDKLIKKGSFAEITRLTREAVGILHSFAFAHLGINPGGGSAEDLSAQLSVFGLPEEKRPKSTFVSSFFELMHQDGPGEKGHIAIACNNVARAIPFLEKNGAEILPGSLQYKGDAPVFAYLKNHVGGFAVHLLQR